MLCCFKDLNVEELGKESPSESCASNSSPLFVEDTDRDFENSGALFIIVIVLSIPSLLTNVAFFESVDAETKDYKM